MNQARMAEQRGAHGAGPGEDSWGPLILLYAARHNPLHLIPGVWPSLPGGAPGPAHQRGGAGRRSHSHRP